MMSGKLVWSFQRGAWVLDDVGVGFMVGWGFSRASKIYLGIWSVRHLGGCF